MTFSLPNTGGALSLRLALGFSLAAILVGCGKEDIKVYRVAKDKEAPEAVAAANPHTGAGAMDNPHGMAEGLPKIKFKLPAGWEERPAGTMRVASFLVMGTNGMGADVAVIPLPGAGGRQMDMVNMWRQQLRLPTATDEESAKLGEEISVGSEKARLFDLASTEKLVEDKYPARILGAIFARGDTAWFFKMAGEDELVSSQKGAFKDFLKSIEFVSAPAAAPVAGGMPPMAGSMPPMGPGAMAAPAAGAGETPPKPTWTVPAGWTEQPPRPMTVARFLVIARNANVEISVSAFPGDVGGLLANVNRWRAQMSLNPIGAAELPNAVQEIDVSGAKASLVELDGIDAKSNSNARLVGVIVPQTTQTWFYKMTGHATVVAREKEALLKFVQGVKYAGQ